MNRVLWTQLFKENMMSKEMEQMMSTESATQKVANNRKFATLNVANISFFQTNKNPVKSYKTKHQTVLISCAEWIKNRQDNTCRAFAESHFDKKARINDYLNVYKKAASLYSASFYP